MRLTFRLRFHTHYGQSLLLTGDHEIFGAGDLAKAIALEYLNETTWQITIVLPRGTAPDVPITYNYALREPNGATTVDWGRDRIIRPAACAHEEILIFDSWNEPGYPQNAFYTKPFRDVLLRRNGVYPPAALPTHATHIFNVKAPLLKATETLCLLGAGPALHEWNTASPILLNHRPNPDFFTADLDLANAPFPLSYKFGVYDLERAAFIRFEDGPNRTLSDHVSPHKITIVNDGFARLPTPDWKGAGVAIPVFSLRTERGFGVGEFSDLKLLVDWCAQTGLKLIQLLPINDTTATHTWRDSYPYAAISAFALHPLYLNLEQTAEAKNRPLLQPLESERARLNALESVDYESVLKAKLGFMDQLYPLQKADTSKSEEFGHFVEQNNHWLAPYAAFCWLRDKYGSSDFNQWPACRNYSKDEIEALKTHDPDAADAIGKACFVQFHLHRQLNDAVAYAHANGVVLKGDIAIGVSRYGADVWQQPDLYHTDKQAGAPPDPFGAKGQNWGFPTYNWARMKEDGFAWWKQRFHQMSLYFDAFRIDHILGFFRIWSIPIDAVEGILGHFVPALPVRLDELCAADPSFEPARYVLPFITPDVLSDLFGADADWIANLFLNPENSGNCRFKPEFANQRQVERFFARLPGDSRHHKLKLGLFDLISNLILLEPDSPNGQAFHFRFGIDTTPSFANLSSQARTRLPGLYLDYFFRRQDGFWRQEAMEKLPALKRATNLLVCGEDLGMVPACVPEVMRRLGLLSLEVQRMPKAQGQTFSQPAQAPYLSVVAPSTHDMSTIRGWWKEDRQQTQKFFNDELHHLGPAPIDCEPWINQAIVLQHLSSPAMWSIFQLQDLLGLSAELRRPDPDAERINVPANPEHYWRYRLHLPLEALNRAGHFNAQVRELIDCSGRSSAASNQKQNQQHGNGNSQ